MFGPAPGNKHCPDILQQSQNPAIMATNANVDSSSSSAQGSDAYPSRGSSKLFDANGDGKRKQKRGSHGNQAGNKRHKKVVLQQGNKRHKKVVLQQEKVDAQTYSRELVSREEVDKLREHTPGWWLDGWTFGEWIADDTARGSVRRRCFHTALFTQQTLSTTGREAGPGSPPASPTAPRHPLPPPGYPKPRPTLSGDQRGAWLRRSRHSMPRSAH